MAMVLEAFRGSPLEECPEMVGVRDRLQAASSDVRSATWLPLLDVLTNPDPADGRRQLGDISSALSWSQKFKKEARVALDEGGFDALLERARSAAEAKSNQPRSLLDEVLASSSLVKSGKLGDDQVVEANSLIQQFKAGNECPGIGSSTLGKGIMYLRGRRGTRIFYRMREEKPEWLAVVNKGDEQSAINLLRKTFDLR